MADLSGKDQANYVRHMFSRLARRYDLVNRWMTWGQDVKWRHEVIDKADLPSRGRLLDIGTGTGDLALNALYRENNLHVVGADFTPEMMQVGRNRQNGKSVLWLNTDALYLPFAAKSFNAVVSGYLLRNVVDIQRTLSEQYRVLKSGGHMVCLDTSPPPGDIWHLPERLYLSFIIPFIGGMLTRDLNAYRYLPQSTRRFMRADELASNMREVGFKDVQYRQFMGGTMAIHSGIK